MDTFKEYEVVIANKNMETVPKGARGTILMIFEDGKYYEVEFVDENGNTYNVLTVSADDIQKCG